MLALFLATVMVGHAPMTLGRRADLVRINEQFERFLASREPLRIDDAVAEPQTATVAVVGGPSVLLASGIIADAIDQATQLARESGQEDLAKRQAEVLRDALQEGLDTIDDGAAVLEDSEPLYKSAVERLGQRGPRKERPGRGRGPQKPR